MKKIIIFITILATSALLLTNKTFALENNARWLLNESDNYYYFQNKASSHTLTGNFSDYIFEYKVTSNSDSGTWKIMSLKNPDTLSYSASIQQTSISWNMKINGTTVVSGVSGSSGSSSTNLDIRFKKIYVAPEPEPDIPSSTEPIDSRWKLVGGYFEFQNKSTSYNLEIANFNAYEFEYRVNDSSWRSFTVYKKLTYTVTLSGSSINWKLLVNGVDIISGVDGAYGSNSSQLSIRYRVATGNPPAVPVWQYIDNGFYYYDNKFNQNSDRYVNLTQHSTKLVEYRVVNIQQGTQTDWAKINLNDNQSLVLRNTIAGYTSNTRLLLITGVTENQIASATINQTLNSRIELRYKQLEPPTLSATTNRQADYKSKLSIASIQSGISMSDIHYKLSELTTTVIKDTYSLNWNKVGNYEVEFEVKNPSNLSSRITINIKVVDNDMPIFTGITTINIPSTSPKSVNEIIKDVKVNDAHDGDITNKIIVETNTYTQNASKPNKNNDYYIILLSATDSSGNKAMHEIRVYVKDAHKPVFSGINSINVSSSSPMNITEIISKVNVIDAHDGNLNNKIVVETNTYTQNATTPNKNGEYYKIILSATDAAGNKAIHEIKVFVIDTDKPIFNGVLSVTKSYTKVMTVNDIIKDVTVTDVQDGNMTNKIVIEVDTYTGNGNVPNKNGEYYRILLSATDSSGNKSTHEIKVYVIDDKSAEWFITNGITINLANGANLTRQQIINLLNKTGNINISPESLITYSIDNYTENVGEPGLYTLAFNIKQPNGTEEDYSFNINVFGDNKEDIDKTPPATFIEKIKNFFKDNKVRLIIYSSIFIVVASSGYVYYLYNRKKRR